MNIESIPKNLNPQLTEREWMYVMLAMASYTAELDDNPLYHGNENNFVPEEGHAIGCKLLGISGPVVEKIAGENKLRVADFTAKRALGEIAIKQEYL